MLDGKKAFIIGSCSSAVGFFCGAYLTFIFLKGF